MPHPIIHPASPIVIAHFLLLVAPGFAAEVLHHPGSANERALHQDSGHQQVELTLDNGKRWHTDAALRDGMERIRAAAVEVAHFTNANGDLDIGQRRTLADTIDESITFMVTHCHLPPKADANLHILIGRMAGAAAKLRNPTEAKRGLAKLQAALKQYPRYFEHPGW